MLNNPTYNVLQKIVGDSINIIYDSNNTIFDKLLAYTDLGIYSKKSISSYDIPADCYVSNDILDHSNTKNSLCNPLHLSDLVIFHELPSNRFKKEDYIILKGLLKNTHKVFMHDSLVTGWGMVDHLSYKIDYGLPILDHTTQHKRSSVIILNSKQTNNVKSLYEYIKNVFPDAEMLTNMSDMSMQQIANKISSYKVCIELDYMINMLFASACGCYTITNMTDTFNQNLIGSFGITDFTNISNMISTILNSYQLENFANNFEYIKRNHSFETFKSNIELLMSTIKKEPFVYEKNS
jgi:hypothetical protein